MTPFQTAREMFNQREVNPADPLMFSTFDLEYRCWMHFGYVMSTPKFFVMAKPVNLADPNDCLWEPSHVTEDPNAWLVHTFVGDMREAFYHMPFVLDYMVYYRAKSQKTLVLNSYRLWQRLLDHGQSSENTEDPESGPTTVRDAAGYTGSKTR